MRIRDLLRMWIAEQLFQHELVLVIEIPKQSSRDDAMRVESRFSRLTGYETIVTANLFANQPFRFSLLPKKRTATARVEATA